MEKDRKAIEDGMGGGWRIRRAEASGRGRREVKTFGGGGASNPALKFLGTMTALVPRVPRWPRRRGTPIRPLVFTVIYFPFSVHDAWVEVRIYAVRCLSAEKQITVCTITAPAQILIGS